MSSNSPYIYRLSNELQEKARSELNEDPVRREESIAIIREWIEQQPHLNSRTDDIFILRFLRKCKFSLQLTKESIDNFYTMRASFPDYFSKRDPLDPKMQELINRGIFLILPGYDNEGRKVTLTRFGAFDPMTVDFNTLQKLNSLISEILFHDEQVQISGIGSIADFSGFSGSHLSIWNISFAKQQTAFWQNCLPLRIRTVSICNENAVFHKVAEIVKVFLKEKLKKRIVFHGKNMKSLHQYFPRNILPEEYGGTAGPISKIIAEFKTELESRRDQFLEEDKYGIDESKRIGKSNIKEDLFGLDGSFRKLNID